MTIREKRRILTEEEERQLLKRASTGDQRAMTNLLKMFKPLIMRISAPTIRKYPNDRDDIIQDASMGFMDAVLRYDQTRETRLSTYAYHWIRMKIQGGVMMRTRPISTPRTEVFQQLKSQVIAAQHKLTVDGRRMSLDEAMRHVAALHNTDIERVKLAYATTGSTVTTSIDAPLPNSEGMVFGDLIADPNADQEMSYEEFKRQKFTREILAECLARLEPRMADILLIRYIGSPDYGLASFDQIAQKYGVSRQAIQQSEVRAIRNLRAVMDDVLAERGLDPSEFGMTGRFQPGDEKVKQVRRGSRATEEEMVFEVDPDIDSEAEEILPEM